MNDRPLFYRSIVPLNRDTHRDLRLASESLYAFAADSHLIPAVVDEFAAACAEIPILYVGSADDVSPVFLTGTSPGHNRFVDAKGAWRVPYVPAYLRRYPFILGEVKGAEPLICFDEKAETFRAPTTHDKPAPLFKTDGGDADSLIERIRLVTDYAAAAKRTQAMSRLLQELKLLQPLTIQTASDSGTMSAIHGLLGVNETVLNGLSDSNFLRLRTEGYLGSIYMHLVSLRAIDRLPRQVE